MIELIQKNKILALILGLSVLGRLMASVMLGDPVVSLPGTADQISYHALAVRLVKGYGFTFPVAWWPMTQAGAPTAHWSYLYTMFLAGVYGVFGVHPLVARLIQAVVAGVMMPLLTYRVANRVFGAQVFVLRDKVRLNIPLISAAWTALYGYFVYYAAALMTETFYIIGILWSLNLALDIASSLEAGKQRISAWKWLELGAAIGITVLLRQVFLLFVPFLFLWFWWIFAYKTQKGGYRNWRDGFRRAFRGGVLVGLVLIVFIAPFTWLNYKRFDRFVLLNTNAGFAFFWANHPVHGTDFIDAREMDSYQDLVPEELRNLDEAALDQALLKRSFEFVTNDPWRYIRLSLSRIDDYFMFWPLKQSSLPSNIVRVFSYGVALPFILWGVFIWVRKTRQGEYDGFAGTLLLLFAVIYTAIHLLSWALIRYRLPVDAVTLPFGAVGLLDILKRLSRKNKE